MTTPDEVLAFWLGAPAQDHDSFMHKIRRWFGVDKALDAEIRARFGDDVQRARDGALDAWAKTPRGRLALIILLDQFTRNLHRGTARSYENDARGLALAEAGIDAREDEALSYEEKMFLYMPLTHSEDVSRQERHVVLVEAAVNAAPVAMQKAYATALAHARGYLEQIRRFGRFPHRNAILGRTCTQEEMAFLDSPSTNG
ncbi:MAG TPA: DUF924 family protein [Polyangia bacterium]|nr:DUF924 family protein [Polyangia bacterium]